LFQKGRAHDREGRFEDAARALDEAIVLNPRASSYYYVLAGVYRRLGWLEESRKALEVFKRLEQESRDLEAKRRREAGGAARPKPESRRDQR
jgi:tetratricopeptide (TPR) repeat protein